MIKNAQTELKVALRFDANAEPTWPRNSLPASTAPRILIPRAAWATEKARREADIDGGTPCFIPRELR